jgi:hypothetical protein
MVDIYENRVLHLTWNTVLQNRKTTADKALCVHDVNDNGQLVECSSKEAKLTFRNDIVSCKESCFRVGRKSSISEADTNVTKAKVRNHSQLTVIRESQ